MTTLLQDVRYGVRMLLKRPGFTIIAVLALALGIGANMAIFSVVNAVLLKPLPYPHAERLVFIWGNAPKLDLEIFPTSAPDFVDYRNRNHVFERIAAFEEASFNLTSEGAEPLRVRGVTASADLFPTLGVQPKLGRTFSAEEEAGRNHVVMLSYDLWQRRFGGDAKVIGRAVTLNNESYSIIGVLPPTFRFPESDSRIDVWTPLDLTSKEMSRRGHRNLLVVARLKDGVTLDQANKEMSGITAQLAESFPDTNEDWGVNVASLSSQLTEDIEPALWVLFGAVGFVLLIACANVANLQLARAAARQREVAVRAALGASRWRLIRQFLTESVLLASASGALALLFALWGIDFLVALLPADVPRAEQIGVDAPVLIFTLAVSLLTGVLLGLAPALQGTRPDLTRALKEVDKSALTLSKRNRVRGLLVIAEVALSLLLLIGAGLMVESFWRLRHVKPGIDPSNVLTMNMALSSKKYPESYQRADFFKQVLERVEALPNVQAAGVVTNLPFSDSDSASSFTIEGRPEPKSSADAVIASYGSISPNYFRAMSIPVVKGRAFAAQDTKQAPPVVVISETFARRFFAGEDPIGKRLKQGGSRDTGTWLTAVGVAGDVHRYGLQAKLKPEIYFPYLQSPHDGASLVVRTAAGNPASVAEAVRREVRAVDKEQPVYDVKTMDELLSQSIASPRLAALLLGSFAALALLLASIGIYGVVSYSVSQRTHEIGIRMALGASQGDVLRLVVGQGMLLTVIGTIIGLCAALMLTRVLASLLYGTSAIDPIVFASISALLLGVALLACYLPARRAMRIEPSSALRYE